MNLSVVILPAKVLADGQHKIRIAISHNSQTRYWVTRHVVPSVDNIKRGVVVGVGNASYINQQLRTLQTQIYKIYDEMEDAECYSCSQLIDVIKSRIDKKKLTSFADISGEWMELNKDRWSYNSKRLYREGIEMFSEFAGGKYILSGLTPMKVVEFDRFLINKKGLATTTANMRIRVLRSICRYATTRKYVSFEINPFIDYKEHPEIVRDIALDVYTLRKIRDCEITNEKGVIARDIFMLSFYLCGMNLADIVRVNFSKSYVSFNRQKTENRRKDGMKIEFDIQPEARAIIDKYITKSGTLRFNNKEHLFSVHNFLHMHLPKVEEAARLDFKLLFYCARKTFAQLAIELDVRERVIEYCIGDKQNVKHQGSMIGYYTKTNKQMADEAIRKVFDFVAKVSNEETQTSSME